MALGPYQGLLRCLGSPSLGSSGLYERIMIRTPRGSPVWTGLTVGLSASRFWAIELEGSPLACSVDLAISLIVVLVIVIVCVLLIFMSFIS